MERVHYDLVSVSRHKRNSNIVMKGNVDSGQYICKINGTRKNRDGSYIRFLEPIYKVPFNCDENLMYFITDFLTREEVILNVYVSRILAAFSNNTISSPNVLSTQAKELYIELQHFAYKMPLKNAWEFCRKEELVSILKEFKQMLSIELKEGRIGKCMYILKKKNIDMRVPFNIKFLDAENNVWNNNELNFVKVSIEFSNLERIEETTLADVVDGRCINYFISKNSVSTYVLKKENPFKRAISIFEDEYIFTTNTFHKFFVLI